MLSVLNNLNRVAGVRGSMIVDPDGIVVASDMAEGLDEQTAGAMASSILKSICAALGKMNQAGFERYLVTGKEGRAAIVKAGRIVLVVIMDKSVNLGMVQVQIKDAAKAIEAKSTF